MNFFLNQYNKPGLLQTGVNTHPNWTQKLGFHFSGLSQCESNVNQVHHMIQFWSTTWSSPSAPNGFYGWTDYSFVVFGLSSLFKPWIGRKRPWTWFHLLLNNYWNKKSEFSSVYFNCFSNLTFQDDYWQTVKKVCRPKATVPGYAVRRWPGSKNHNVSMTGKAGEAEGSPRLMITSTHTRTTKKKVKKVTEWGCRFKGKQSDRLLFGN